METASVPAGMGRSTKNVLESIVCSIRRPLPRRRPRSAAIPGTRYGFPLLGSTGPTTRSVGRKCQHFPLILHVIRFCRIHFRALHPGDRIMLRAPRCSMTFRSTTSW